jgi:hypothetical protein
MEFVLSAIREHKTSSAYLTAADAELYYKHQNPTIMRYQKFVYNQLGQKVPNTWSANNRIASNWYYLFITQAVSYLLGNGVSFEGKDETKNRLGDDFDNRIQDIATESKVSGVSFGFWNYDHLEVFKITEFAPLYDEEDGGLKAGVRFWQIDNDRPLRATLYELDGYTDFIKRKDEEITVLHEKRPYTQTVKRSDIEGETILDGANYPGFPIVPMWNVNRQAELEGNGSTIDAYDLMISGLVNNVSDGEFLYWILTNCDGMTETEVVQFIEQLALTHVARAGNGDGGAKVDAHQANVPTEGTEAALNRLEKQLYRDFMALKVEDISAGSVTATQILAAYEPINQKTDQFEYELTKFIKSILFLAGIEDTPTYTRSQMSNQSEVLDMVIQSAEYLDDEYMTAKILTILGDADKVEDVLKRKLEEDSARYAADNNAGEEDTTTEEGDDMNDNAE